MLWPLVTSYRTPDLPWLHMLEKVCPPMKRFLEEHVPYFMETPCVLEKILLFASYFSRNLFFVPCFIQCIIWINWINLYIYIHIYIYTFLSECRMWCLYIAPSLFFSYFLFALFIQASFFFDYYRLCHQRHHNFHFIFINTASHQRIQHINSSGMVSPYTLITLGQT